METVVQLAAGLAGGLLAVLLYFVFQLHGIWKSEMMKKKKETISWKVFEDIGMPIYTEDGFYIKNLPEPGAEIMFNTWDGRHAKAVITKEDEGRIAVSGDHIIPLEYDEVLEKWKGIGVIHKDALSKIRAENSMSKIVRGKTHFSTVIKALEEGKKG